MINSQWLDEIAQRLTQVMPSSLSNLQDEMQRKFREILSAGLNQCDVVSREEFDAQVKVLARTRAKLEALEKQVADMDKASKNT